MARTAAGARREKEETNPPPKKHQSWLRIGYIINTCKANHTDTPQKKQAAFLAGPKQQRTAQIWCAVRARLAICIDQSLFNLVLTHLSIYELHLLPENRVRNTACQTTATPGTSKTASASHRAWLRFVSVVRCFCFFNNVTFYSLDLFVNIKDAACVLSMQVNVHRKVQTPTHTRTYTHARAHTTRTRACLRPGHPYTGNSPLHYSRTSFFFNCCHRQFIKH